MQQMVKILGQIRSVLILMHTCCAPCSLYSGVFVTRYCGSDGFILLIQIFTPKAVYQRHSLYLQNLFMISMKILVIMFVLKTPYEPQEFFGQYMAWKIRKVAIVVSLLYDYRLDKDSFESGCWGFDWPRKRPDHQSSLRKFIDLINSVGIEVQKGFMQRGIFF